MKKQTIEFVCSCLLIVAASAAHSVENASFTQEQLDQVLMETVGGHLIKPGSGRGCIVLVNAQKRVQTGKLDETFNAIRDILHVNIVVKDGSLSGLPSAKTVKKDGGTLAIYFVDRAADGTTLLVAPEEKWAVVDVAALSKDDPLPARLINRVQKEAVRAFCWLCGCANSQYQGMVTGPAKSLTDLDRMGNHELPLDSYQKVISYLEGLRVTPREEVTYADACQQGWAPNPTNKWQKAIWDAIHAPPKNPMTIKFDPQKGR